MKKFLIFFVAVIAVITYVNSHYSVQDAVDYVQAKPDPKWTPRVEYYAGTYFEMKDRHEEAIKTLETLLETYPDTEYTDDAIFHLGEAYENTRQKPKATELYQKYLDEYPKGSQADLARRKLELFKSQ